MFVEVDKRGREEVALWVYFYRRRLEEAGASPPPCYSTYSCRMTRV